MGSSGGRTKPSVETMGKRSHKKAQKSIYFNFKYFALPKVTTVATFFRRAMNFCFSAADFPIYSERFTASCFAVIRFVLAISAITISAVRTETRKSGEGSQILICHKRGKDGMGRDDANKQHKRRSAEE